MKIFLFSTIHWNLNLNLWKYDTFLSSALSGHGRETSPVFFLWYMWTRGENHSHQQHFFIITIFPHQDICSDGQQHHIVINLSKLSSLQVYEAPPECVMSKENCLGIQVIFLRIQAIFLGIQVIFPGFPVKLQFLVLVELFSLDAKLDAKMQKEMVS